MEREEREEQERLEAEEKEKQIAEKEKEKEKEKGKEKSKPGKKGKTNGTTTASKDKDVTVVSKADAVPAIENDSWGTWGTTKAKDKKKGGRKDAMLDPPPPAPTPPAQGLTPEPTPEPPAEVVADFDDYNGNGWASFGPAKTKGKKDGKKNAKAEESEIEKTPPKEEVGDAPFDFLQDNEDEWSKNLLEEEAPAPAAKSFWSLGTGLTGKSKSSKEHNKPAVQASEVEELPQDLIDLDLKLGGDSFMDTLDEPGPKGFKFKAESKLSSSSAKESEKSSKLSDSKKKKGWGMADSWGAAVGVTAAAEVATEAKTADDDINIDTNATANAKGDSWSFWGASKKPSGKSGIAANAANTSHSGSGGKLADDPKKEIAKHGLANQNDSLGHHPFSFSKDPEPPWLDDQAEPPKSSKPTKSTMSSVKPVNKQS